MAVLQHLACAETSRGLQKVFQLVQGAFGGSLFLGKAVRVQSHQDCTLLGLFIKSFFHITSAFSHGKPRFLFRRHFPSYHFFYYTTHPRREQPQK